MFLIVYCALAIAVFFWIFGFTTAAIIVALLTLALIGYASIRRQVARKRLLKQRTATKGRG
ncbi:hypothetical protein [Lactiplantibacillus mudanjiangensis]|uniref:Uncharacterized protein n=1 Tax=Lactiplantibacillus mudanjiangensis TaxID=1296538 RepID=A0A660DW52_9LACO|nr:hypothetical protein [Lactiplantibacillus mudanjiangensis]VDG18845.1 hypothetical protein [Lactobacillus sp. CBA3605] [Lactiplantibacillus mudanjiangensis]VDG25376.1 hypothetical protein [Lactobacillus sp. CBA3605] [Lactiplantibacillus mudanjiangensis]VDG27593.1 hypothetical protein [Lactobacillus sp. CBA3605] [Lactiplantibacillus mudanjiangensis]VDG32944.1 hypothetical protein [Lactobacillus sp. CBA3605] [Lactiplantibacillus mudanjiangensis]